MNSLFAPAVLVLAAMVGHAAEVQVLDSERRHLGVAGSPEWEEFSASTPHGRQLDLTFKASAGESTLLIRQRNVKTTWNVVLNGQKLGALETLTQPLVLALPIPGGLLRAGDNRLSISRAPSRMLDDVVVGEITLDPRPRSEILGEAILAVTVTDADTGAAVPCRLTLVDAEGALEPLQPLPGQPLAVRTGVIYTGDGRARFGVVPGRHVLYAGRGFEYSVATETLTIAPGETRSISLQIRREVPTPGLVACDTHIHTLTHSKHGDATIDERMLTIAGEGIEVAVATDHNHHTDYTETVQRTGMGGHFQSIVGNEVSTKVGHFNAFPVEPGGTVPDARLMEWTELFRHIRAVTGARVITLNHPRDVHQAFTPFGPQSFNAATGELLDPAGPGFDAVEVVTSAAMQSDVMLLFRDWFALLNHGIRVAGIAASDTHHVSEFILGQARTYVAASGATPAEIDIDEVCASYQAGRLLVSLGLLTQMTVDDRFAVGQVATGLGDELHVAVEVLGPSWANADRVELFSNGTRIRTQTIAPGERVQKARVNWAIPRPAHDVHLVAIATGPGVTAPYWEIPRPYQPRSKTFNPRVLGATNPIWIDGDGDGRFTAARSYAATLVRTAAGNQEALQRLLADFDPAVAVQAADLLAGSVPKAMK